LCDPSIATHFHRTAPAVPVKITPAPVENFFQRDVRATFVYHIAGGSPMRSLLIGSVIAYAATAHADTIHLNSGRAIENAVIVQKNESSVVFSLGYGTITLPSAEIKSIEPKPVDAPQAEKPRRMPGELTIITAAGKQPWATNFRQIPATVIDKGVLAHVPYMSYQCGDGYELNIYGDPDQPAGIEMGITGDALKDAEARSNCIQFIASVLTDKDDASIVKSLNRNKDSHTRKELTFEITPISADDSYGGWWISVYDKGRLNSVRATPAEIKEITVAKDAVQAPKAIDETAEPQWTAEEITEARSAPATVGGGTGRVYVRGYYRKDGTYVRSHSRSRPKRR
jgi:hypothetical protein